MHEPTENFIQQCRQTLGQNLCFLPDTIPIASLPDQFSVVEQTCRLIADDYCRNGQGVRLRLDCLFTEVDSTLLDATDALSLAQQQCLMNMLSILAHCYRWDRSPPDEHSASLQSLSLPPGLISLWKKTAKLTGQPKVGTNANLKYWNWQLVGRKPGSRYNPIDLLRRKVSVNHNWLSGDARGALENWILTFVLAEAVGSLVITPLLQSIQYALSGNRQSCLTQLQELHQSMKQFNQVFGRLLKGSRVDAGIWLKQVQHTFAWGLRDEESGELLQGPSGMQVGVIQAINLGLCIPAQTEMARMSASTRSYYTPQHQQFFKLLEQHAPALGRFTDQHTDLSTAYNDCLNELIRWRVSHQKRGAWYLQKAGEDTNRQRISTGLTLPAEVDGTERFIDLMQQRIEETQTAKK